MRKPEVDKPGKQYGVVEYRAPQQKIARKLTPHLPFFMRVASGRPVTDADHCKAEVEGQKPALGWLPTFASGCFPVVQSRGESSQRFLPRRQLP